MNAVGAVAFLAVIVNANWGKTKQIMYYYYQIKKWRQLLLQFHLIPFFSFLVKSIEQYANCTCSNFINENGYGNCQKLNRGLPLCYVNEPSDCTDLIFIKRTGRSVSWKACTSSFGKYCWNTLFVQTMKSKTSKGYPYSFA